MTNALITKNKNNNRQLSRLPGSSIAEVHSETLVFLDFDGVTHPEPSAPDQNFSKLALIEAVLRYFPNVEVVISSSWREHFKLDRLREFFSPDIAQRVIGVTPSSKAPSSDWLPIARAQGQGERQAEIETWMRQHKEWGTPWVAIDDRQHWFRENCPDLLVTDRAVGFTAEDAEKLIAMLTQRSHA